MSRISWENYNAVFSVIYLGLMANLVLLLTSLPLVLLLLTTDPVNSWPLLIIAGAFAVPGITALFATFHEHNRGSMTVARNFFRGLKNTWRRALIIGLAVVGLAVVLIVDIRVLSSNRFAVLAIPGLVVVLVLTVIVGLHALVVVTELPHIRVREALRASVYCSVRRIHLSLVTVLVLGVQAALFTSVPALAIGITASGALYLAWANSRYSLRPLLSPNAVPVS